MSKINKLFFFIFLIFINVDYCLANNNYFISTLPTIINGLKSNNDDLIAQQRVIYITKQALNELVNKKEITINQADQAKKTIEDIFKENFKRASNYQRAMYTMKRPFQFVYQKITNPQANYLERFAYGAAAAVGVGITVVGLYHTGKYAYSTLPTWQKETTNLLTKKSGNEQLITASTFDELGLTKKLPSTEELQNRLTTININPDIKRDISKALGDTTKTPLGVINTVKTILSEYASHERLDRQSLILWQDSEIVSKILQDYPDILEKIRKNAKLLFP